MNFSQFDGSANIKINFPVPGILLYNSGQIIDTWNEYQQDSTGNLIPIDQSSMPDYWEKGEEKFGDSGVA